MRGDVEGVDTYGYYRAENGQGVKRHVLEKSPWEVARMIGVTNALEKAPQYAMVVPIVGVAYVCMYAIAATTAPIFVLVMFLKSSFELSLEMREQRKDRRHD